MEAALQKCQGAADVGEGAMDGCPCPAPKAGAAPSPRASSLPSKEEFGKMAATDFPLSEHFRRASNTVKDSAFWTCYVGICYI